ncbi:MAG: hypothetical protein ACYDEV_00055 [Acidiferrobacter sp.]
MANDLHVLIASFGIVEFLYVIVAFALAVQALRHPRFWLTIAAAAAVILVVWSQGVRTFRHFPRPNEWSLIAYHHAVVSGVIPSAILFLAVMFWTKDERQARLWWLVALLPTLIAFGVYFYATHDNYSHIPQYLSVPR